MKWISTINLDAWGSTRTSETELPGLVSDLIRATGPDINAMRFPTGEKGQVRGFDGTLDSSVAALNIPAGRSYWEFGTERDYQSKALRDFKKRDGEVSSPERAASTLVLVTPFTWDSSRSDNKIEDWENARKAESNWRDVKVIDGQQLEDWLAKCPAVSAWHARNTFHVAPRDGVRSIEDFWSAFANRFDPRLLEEMLTVERERQVEELLTGLMGDPQPLRFVADSPDDVVAFAIAAIRTAKPEVRLFLEARTLVVDTQGAVRELIGRRNLVFLARGEAARAPGQLADIGPTLVPLGRQQRSTRGVALERPSSFAMAGVLTKMNIPRARAEALAKGCGRSLTALARQIPGGEADIPKWVEDASQLLPAILAGAWDGANALDQAVVAAIAGAPSYTAYESSVRRHVDGGDPALDREGTVYKVRAPMDAFIHAGHLIGREHLDALRPIMTTVFGELAPDADPDATFRFDANRPLRHSEWLREGLATTLLLIALWQENARLSIQPREGQRFADEIMGALPGLGSDHRLLASLKNELPMLAEAAPDVFLSALERMLEGDGAAIRPIFDEAEGLVFPRSEHTGVLWALETLAWDRRSLPRVCLILARLAEVDPGGRISNRPEASLGEIFLPWHPGTSAPLDARLAIIDEILARHPEIGWKLLVRSLPQSMGVSSGTARPRLRDVDASVAPLTHGDVLKAYAEIIDRALSAAGIDPDRLKELIRPMARFAPAQFKEAIEALDRSLSSVTGQAKEGLWTALRDDLRRHERFRAADWALPDQEFAEVRRIVTKHAPSDPVVATAQLFDGRAPGDDAEAAAARRAAAVAALYREHGPAAALALIKGSRLGHLVLRAIDDGLPALSDIEGLLRASVAADPNGQTTASLSTIHFRHAGETAALALIRELHASAGDDGSAATLLLGWPVQRATWRAARELGAGVERRYWSDLRPHWLEGSRRTLLELMLHLLAHGRAIAALESAGNRLDEVPTGLLFRALDGIVTEIQGGGGQGLKILDYEIEQIFKSLDARHIDGSEIARREYAFLPLLEHGERPLRLHRLMVEDADLFHAILRDVYRGDEEPPHDGTKPDVVDRERWRHAFRLLSSLKQAPGFTAPVPDRAALAMWMDEVRELGAKHGRVDITESVIGRVLAHAPEDDSDQGWPHRFVRDEIERAPNGKLVGGIRTERYNMRGATTRGLYDGGDQERDLANQYERYARICDRWPATAAMLDQIAEGWRREAEREDADARQRRLRS